MVRGSRDDIMGMPIVIAIIDDDAMQKDIDAIFTFFEAVDRRFSTFKHTSEVALFNRHEIKEKDLSPKMRLIMRLAEQTKKQTYGYFDIQKKDGTIDPSGIVKGWAIWQAAQKLMSKGFQNFFIEAGGDIQAEGKNEKGEKWRVGIKNPFQKSEIVKVLSISGKGVATSGTYEKGQHVYNPHKKHIKLTHIVSITVIAPNIYEADRFATAAFAMQEKGIDFIEKLKNCEGYMIHADGLATMTSGFEKLL